MFFCRTIIVLCGKLIRIPGLIPCSLFLILLFCLPSGKLNGWYEAACVIIGFPLIVAAGAGGKVSGRWARICKFSGEISYPIYITHYPFIYIYTIWVVDRKPSPSQIIPVAIFLFFFFILLAWVALKLYDEPVRAWLKKKYLQRS